MKIIFWDGLSNNHELTVDFLEILVFYTYTKNRIVYDTTITWSRLNWPIMENSVTEIYQLTVPLETAVEW